MKFCLVDTCNKPVFGGGYCKNHQYKRKKSDKQKSYETESKLFRSEGTKCEIKSPVCVGAIQGTHHKKGRIGNNLLDKKHWMRACNPCNDYCEAHPNWAKENGFSESRLIKDFVEVPKEFLKDF